MNKVKEIAEKIEDIKEFGSIPRYAVECGKKYIYVCKNNGQFTRRDMGDGPWATFIGKFTADEAEKIFLNK